MPSFEELFPCNVEDAAYPVHTPLYDTKQSTIILHTSGSTSLPKPVVWRAHHLRQWAIAPWLGDVDLSGVVMACHGLPMFHGIGILQIVSTASCGLIMATFNPSLNTPPTPALVFEEARITKCELICTIPVFIEYWAKDRAKIDHMKTLKGVIFGGGPLSKETGDQLASHGVCLYTSYGRPTILRVNDLLPSDLKLVKEMIRVTSPSKPFEYTSKGTVRRQAALSIYATEIQELYGSPY
ncbi:hypothetical protein PHLCEN_2v227 [Hermanssonia centrifuga]|uniref:AMP-dependent synthetase/ligase domain-containing protein n=1 Tax=Hermanssonia centrifuga TaxID=98765 RepID=A0A2R6S6P9_9APHY|nr:hypothetical protein PHLCEN_2v227 [Hermanssonia centrifuga]